MSEYISKAQEMLKNAHLHPKTIEQRADDSVTLAGYILTEANLLETPQEKRKQKSIALMVNDPSGKIFATRLTDQCFRSSNHWRVAEEIGTLVHKYGIPRFLSWWQRMQLSIFTALSPSIGKYFVPLIQRLVRKETSTVILPGEPDELQHHIALRKSQGIRVNLNHLGEAILGEEEAQKRLQIYLADLRRPDVEYISIKISTIYSQISLLGWNQTLSILTERLKELYRAAKKQNPPKFINLDMEEYRDLRLTFSLFTKVLDEAEFYDYSAGIVIQAYLPDAFLFQQQLTSWAMQRVANGGAPIKIRLVKGANLAMEKVEASIKGWEQATYLTKEEVDANFKKMMNYGCQPEHAAAARLGIGSHNLFDIAYGMLLREENDVSQWVSFEMLEGMAESLRKVVQKISGGMLLYCPTATDDEFQYAVAYLTRRLDENTAPENFLRHLFGLEPESSDWLKQVELFKNSCMNAHTASHAPRRQQNRLETPQKELYQTPFVNSPDTDWSLPQNRIWAERILSDWQYKEFINIPLVINDKQYFDGCQTIVREDPSCTNEKIYAHALADKSHIELALATATEAFNESKKNSVNKRGALLDDVAHILQVRRGDLIGAMIKDTAKTMVEADVEVSEAIDFANFYRRNIEDIGYLNDIKFSPKGTVVVTPPWNFPCSIPAGCILAALAAGNTVIFKPAPEAVLVGWTLANIIWDAGFDKRTFQFICCRDDSEGSLLISDPRVSTVILTGATSTAKKFLNMRPHLDLIAETGGKNAIIITAASDRDLAIKDLLQSAFGHAGQKCSACSLAILEAEVYDDQKFRKQLHDAASSLVVGSAWDLSTKVPPLIRSPSDDLMKALTTLDPGEEWLLEPKQIGDNPRLWSPGIKLGVLPNSFMHETELFGPVLAVMRAENLHEAIQFANGTRYGLTAGIHSLDEREHDLWLNAMVAGNYYINRGITGAIVQRQPFGGCKDSSFGPGAKAGGPNYVMQLMKANQIGLPDEREPLNELVLKMTHKLFEELELDSQQRNFWMAATGSYAFYVNHYFSQDHDPSHILGEDNILRYQQRDEITFRIHSDDNILDTLCVAAAVTTCGAALEISLPDDWKHTQEFLRITKDLGFSMLQENDKNFIDRILSGYVFRVRCLQNLTDEVSVACSETGTTVIVAPVLANGRIELLHYLREMSISYDYHRYGYLGEREIFPSNEQQGCCQKGCGGSCS